MAHVVECRVPKAFFLAASVRVWWRRGVFVCASASCVVCVCVCVCGVAASAFAGVEQHISFVPWVCAVCVCVFGLLGEQSLSRESVQLQVGGVELLSHGTALVWRGVDGVHTCASGLSKDNRRARAFCVWSVCECGGA